MIATAAHAQRTFWIYRERGTVYNYNIIERNDEMRNQMQYRIKPLKCYVV